MSSRLTRRAFFALPVALPVAAVAAKVAPVKPFATGGVVGPARFAPIIDAREIVMRRYPLIPPGTYLVRAPIDLGQQAFDIARLVNGKFDMTPREGAADAAKPVTAQAAAPVGEKSCGGRGVEASARENPAPHGHAPTVGAGHDQQTQAVADRRDRAAPDVGNVAEPEATRESALRSPPLHDTLAQPVAA